MIGLLPADSDESRPSLLLAEEGATIQTEPNLSDHKVIRNENK